jgi:hypothetical protein
MTTGVTGTARSPVTDTLFEADDTEWVSEDLMIWFHRVVAQVLNLAKRTTPETLTAVTYLAIRVTSCTELDVVKLHLSIRRLVSSGAANKIEIAAADNYLSLRDH